MECGDKGYDTIDIPDLLIQRNLEIRTIWQRLRHTKLWQAYGDPEKAYARDNPVVHIKCLDPTWSPEMSDEVRRAWDGGVLVSNNGIYGPWSPNGLMGEAPLLVWSSSTLVTEGTQFMFANTYLRGGKLCIARLQVKTAHGFDSAGRRNWTAEEYYSWSNDYDVVGEVGGIPPGRWDLIGRDLPGRARGHNPISRTLTNIHQFKASLNPDEVVDYVHTEMKRALRYNELELFAASSKESDLSALQPYQLQVALGDAWDHALTPHGDPSDPEKYNPGITTFGFNNLQNLAGCVDGLLTLASLNGEVRSIAEALGDLVTLKSSDERMLQRLANIGKRSKYAMTHDPDWWRLSPNQQRRLIKDADITSVQNSITASMALTPLQDSRPDWAAQIGDPDYASWWFQGRYVWSTSWSDADQAYRYLQYQMQQQLDPLYVNPTLHGRAVCDEDATVRISFKARERAVTGFAKFIDYIYTMGLAPTPAVLWDFVPFSFVVDWFFPVGNSLEQFSRNKFFSPVYYEYYDGYCCSLKYKQQTPAGFRVQCYTRWYQSNCPSVEIGHTLLDGGSRPTDVTTAFRFTDGCLLLFRR